jgi:hypothetical protein
VRDHVRRQEEFLAEPVRIGDADAEIFGEKIVVAHPEAVARQSGVNCVGAESERITHVFQGAGRREKFYFFHGVKIGLSNRLF